MGCNLSAAHGVGVGVSARVSREVVEEQVRSCGNELTVIVGDTASAESSGIESSLSGLSAGHEAW